MLGRCSRASGSDGIDLHFRCIRSRIILLLFLREAGDLSMRAIGRWDEGRSQAEESEDHQSKHFCGTWTLLQHKRNGRSEPAGRSDLQSLLEVTFKLQLEVDHSEVRSRNSNPVPLSLCSVLNHRHGSLRGPYLPALRIPLRIPPRGVRPRYSSRTLAACASTRARILE